MQEGTTNPFLVILVFCFEGGVGGTGWNSRSLARPADLGFEQSWVAGVVCDQIFHQSEYLFLTWVGGHCSNLQPLRYMSLLHIHFMNSRGGGAWSFPPDLAHDKWLPFLRRESQAGLRRWLSLCRHFSLVHPHLCPHPCPGAGEGGLRGTEGWEDGKVFIFKANLYHCKDFLKLLFWYLFQSSNLGGDP